jgi:hypothetical protein
VEKIKQSFSAPLNCEDYASPGKGITLDDVPFSTEEFALCLGGKLPFRKNIIFEQTL